MSQGREYWERMAVARPAEVAIILEDLERWGPLSVDAAGRVWVGRGMIAQVEPPTDAQ